MNENNNNNNDFRGWSLFNDIEDPVLRTRNRSVVLSNMAEDYTNKEKRISPKGASLILGYFNRIPMDERTPVKERFANFMMEKGFALVK